MAYPQAVTKAICFALDFRPKSAIMFYERLDGFSTLCRKPRFAKRKNRACGMDIIQDAGLHGCQHPVNKTLVTDAKTNIRPTTMKNGS